MMLRIMFCGVLMLISKILCSGNHNILSQLWMKKCLCLSSINPGFHKLQQFCFIHFGYLSLFFQNKPMNAEISITVSLSPILRQGSVSEMKVIAIMMPSTYQSLNKYLLNE